MTVSEDAGGMSLRISLLEDSLVQAIPLQDAQDPQRLCCAVQVLIARYLSSAAYAMRLRHLADDIVWDWREAA